MRDGVSQGTSSSPISRGVPSVMKAKGRGRTNSGKLERVFWKAEVVAGVERASSRRVAGESKGINRSSLARFQSLRSILSM